jgi:CubicO group peptidase (beta-lactamase class C family)
VRSALGVVDRTGVVRVAGDRREPLRWASITKLCTALAVLIGVEEGSVGLDAPAGPEGSTVRHLLGHASGLDFDTDTVLAPPGTRRIYSNTGYDLVADVLEECTGIGFETYLREAVFDPLGMGETTLQGSPAAGLVGPLDDLLLLAAELLTPTLLARETYILMRTVSFPGLDGVLPGFGKQEPNDWALGPELRDHKSPHWTGTRNSHRTFGHFGAAGGFLWVDPDAEVAVAVLSDRDFGPWAAEAWPRLSDEILAEAASSEGETETR